MREWIILQPKARKPIVTYKLKRVVKIPVTHGTQIPVTYIPAEDNFVESPLKKGHYTWMPF